MREVIFEMGFGMDDLIRFGEAKYSELDDLYQMPLRDALSSLRNSSKRAPPPPSGGTRKRAKPKRSTARSTKTDERTGKVQTKSNKKKRKKSKAPPLADRVKKVEKFLKKQQYENPKAKFVYKFNAVGQQTIAPNKVGYREIGFWNPLAIEAALDAVPYQTLGAPSTNSTVNTTLVTRHQKIPVKLYAKVVMRNNHNMPLDVDYYIWEPKTDFSVASTLAIELAQDLAKAGVDNTTPPQALTDGVMLYPSDIPFWTANCKVLLHKKVRMKAGDEIIVNTNQNITYDQEYLDEHAETYQVKYCRELLVRVMGVVCHDSVTTTNVGLGDGGFDYYVVRRFDVISPSDMKTLNYETVNNQDAVAVAAIAGPTTGIEEEDV